jgi:hypothetical protein
MAGRKRYLGHEPRLTRAQLCRHTL